LGDDVGQGGLAQAGRTEDQGVVERLAAAARSLDKQLHLLTDDRLADVVGEFQRADGAIQLLLAFSRGSGNQTVGVDHWRRSMCQIIPFRALRISSSLERPSRLIAVTARLASWGL